MQEERMQVLKMVEDGKISVDEATKLFEALKGVAIHPGESFEDKFNNFTKESKSFFKDIGSKVNEMYKKAEPKIKGASKAVAEKTAKVCDNISRSINEKIEREEKKDDCCQSGSCELHYNPPKEEDK